MRINLLPPEFARPSRVRSGVILGLGLGGVLVVFLLITLSGLVQKDYQEVSGVVISQRQMLWELQPVDKKVQALRQELAGINAILKALHPLLRPQGGKEPVSSGLEHIAHSAQVSGEVWLEHLLWSHSGEVILQGYSQTPQELTAFLHELSMWDAFSEIQLQSWQRVSTDHGTLVEFTVQVSSKERGALAD